MNKENQCMPDPAVLLELAKMRMPFGKYKGRLLIDLPEPRDDGSGHVKLLIIIDNVPKQVFSGPISPFLTPKWAPLTIDGLSELIGIS